MILRVASTPSVPGMSRSIRIKSGTSARARATASAPSFAIQATSLAGEDTTTRRSASRAKPMSLAIPILMLGEFDAPLEFRNTPGYFK